MIDIKVLSLIVALLVVAVIVGAVGGKSLSWYIHAHKATALWDYLLDRSPPSDIIGTGIPAGSHIVERRGDIFIVSKD